MTESARIDKLDERVTKIEDDLWTKLNAVDEKLNTLLVTVAKRPECPAPGLCLELSRRVLRLENIYEETAKTVSELIRWRAWLTGVNLVISTVSLIVLGAIATHIVKNL